MDTEVSAWEMNMSTQTDLEEVLEGLVGISHDVETAFTVCAHATRNPALGAVLSKHALVCGGAARSLSSMVRGLRHDGCRGREYSRKLDWLALHDAMARRDDVALRDECIRTEDETLMRFRDALDQHLSGGIQRVVHRYFATLLDCHGDLQSIETHRERRDGPDCYLLHHPPVTSHSNHGLGR